MQTSIILNRAARWQARMRLAALSVLIVLCGMNGVVLAQQPDAPAAQVQPVQSNAAPTEAGSAVQMERFGAREMFLQADVVVKAVMILLVCCSLLTWAVLMEKLIVFNQTRRSNAQFLAAFRKGETATLAEQADKSPMGRMWQVAQSELKQFGRHRNGEANADQINRLLQRMSLTSSIVQERDLARLGTMMGVLATIGATAPFIGLFGTVWGILNSFASIATMKTASLAVVAPGIAEALLATALGLFAAIPAVMIFNKFARDINGFVGSLDNFSAEMIASVSRQMDEGR